MRREPTAIVARPVSTIRIGPHLSEGSRHPAKVVDDILDARMTLDSTDILQMSEVGRRGSTFRSADAQVMKTWPCRLCLFTRLSLPQPPAE